MEKSVLQCNRPLRIVRIATNGLSPQIIIMFPAWSQMLGEKRRSHAEIRHVLLQFLVQVDTVECPILS